MGANVPQVAEGGYTQTLKRSTDMEDQTNIPNEEQTGRLQQTAVGRSFPSIEEAEAYLRSEGIDPDEERAYGLKVVERLKTEIEARKLKGVEEPWHPGCPKRPSEGDCNCG